MKRFVAGRIACCPNCLDDFIDESHAVRGIDAFVDAPDGAGWASTAWSQQRPPTFLASFVTAELYNYGNAGGSPHAATSRRHLALSSGSPACEFEAQIAKSMR
jgi:hypothetical protein